MIERRATTTSYAGTATAVPQTTARHIAIIMDGNRRWAEERGLGAAEGHRAGGHALATIARYAAETGVEYLTAYAFSAENWRREPDEVANLMHLIGSFATTEAPGLLRDGVRVKAIGRLAQLPATTRAAIDALCAATAHGKGLTLTLALNYGARAELADAIRALAEDVAAGRLDPNRIDDAVFERYLLTAGLPDPDLLIRTGGELRLSNFLLYQLAYTELWATPALWPAFGAAEFDEALRAFATRQRRFGS